MMNVQYTTCCDFALQVAYMPLAMLISINWKLLSRRAEKQDNVHIAGLDIDGLDNGVLEMYL